MAENRVPPCNPEHKTHELKIWPEYFEQVRIGRMKFQLRENDRDFKVGDELLLKEWDPNPNWRRGENLENYTGNYTGRELLVRVDYILGAAEAPGSPLTGSVLDEDFVIMSISVDYHVN